MSDPRHDRLVDFVAWTRAHVTGDEKGQAHIFLDHLFQAFGQRGSLDVGGSPEYRIRKAQEDGGGTAFADYVWKPVVLIEMKRRGVDLARHFRQAFDYWIRLVPDRPKYTILSNFDEFWIYDFNVQMDAPVDTVKLEELPERYGPLAFLFPTNETPVFGNDQEAVTRKAADLLGACFNKLIVRRVPRDVSQSFTLQMLVALFAEDIGLLPKYTVTRLLDDCKKPSDSYDLLGGLFEAMNTPGGAKGGRYKGVDYFNGGLFRTPARLELHADELAQLRAAAESNWSQVRPEIFGTIFEQSFNADDAGKKERHAFGAHFTSPVDIMKIVGPTIVEPWRQLIENATSVKELNGLLARMHDYHVLDPACGSGNFLYIAYRELKRLEVRAYERLAELSKRREAKQEVFGFVTAEQFFGMDINPFAVELAKVTMMIGRKLSIDELHITEPALPLDNLDSNFITGDALINGAGLQTAWPPADVIIGNPPFLGAKRLKPEHGPDYVNAVRKLYPEVPGMADYCVYWFNRTHHHLPACTPERPERGRAGLVGTQNIRNNKSREGGLDYIVKSGTIVEAVDNQPWSGEANVHVSIANWVKHHSPNPSGSLPLEGRAGEGGSPVSGSSTGTSPPLPNPPPQGEGTRGKKRAKPGAAVDEAALLIPAKRKLWFKVEPTPGAKKPKRRRIGPANKEYELSFRESTFINAALSDQADVTGAFSLECNVEPQLCFQGVVPGYPGFAVTLSERYEMIRLDPRNAEVVRPWVIGRDLLTGSGQPSRAIIDFGGRGQLEAQSYPVPFNKLKTAVLPEIIAKEKESKDSDMSSARAEHVSRWWQFWNVRRDLREAIAKSNRYIACSRVTKRPIFVFVDASIVPDGATQVWALDDDYSFGVLQSSIHWQWFLAKCSKLKSDFRYTRQSVWDTFPWPQEPSDTEILAVAQAAKDLRAARAVTLTTLSGGLRAAYRSIELPGTHPLKTAHCALDKAVNAAYGWKVDAEILNNLAALNIRIKQRIRSKLPVHGPGLPVGVSAPHRLRSNDFMRASYAQ